MEIVQPSHDGMDTTPGGGFAESGLILVIIFIFIASSLVTTQLFYAVLL